MRQVWKAGELAVLALPWNHTQPAASYEVRARLGRDVVLPLTFEPGRRDLTASDCGAPGPTVCRILVSPCASNDACRPESDES